MIDFWDVINVKKIFLVIIALLCIQFLSYVLVRVFGQRIGTALSGFLSGFISSTAFFLMISFKVKENGAIPTAAAAATLAIVASMIESVLLLLISIERFSPVFLMLFTPPIVLGVIVGAFLSNTEKHMPISNQANPLGLKSVFKLAFFIFGLVTLTEIARKFLGTQGNLVLAAIAGFFEVHAVVIANASAFSSEHISMKDCLDVVAIASVTSVLSKFIIAWTIARNQFATAISVIMFFILCGLLSGLFMARQYL